MINPHNVQTGLAHEAEIDIDLLGPSEIVPFGVRLERTVRDAFDEKLFVTLQEKFRGRANSRVLGCCHVERSRDISGSIFSCLRIRHSSQPSHKATAGQAASRLRSATAWQAVGMTKVKYCGR
jgi:hypothetical protein